MSEREVLEKNHEALLASTKHVHDCKVCVVETLPSGIRWLRACPEGQRLRDAVAAQLESESPIAVALRQDLRARLEKPLSVSSLRALGRVVTASIKTLQATEPGVEGLLGQRPPRFGMGGLGMYAPPDPDAVDLAEGPQANLADYGGGPAYAPAPLLETFGAGSFREIAGMFMKYLDKKNEPAAPEPPTVQELVTSLSMAKTAGVTGKVIHDLEQALENALNPKSAEKPLRTISPSFSVSDDLAAELPPRPEAAIVQACPASSVGST